MDKATMTEWKVYVAVVSGVLSSVVTLFLSPLLLALPFKPFQVPSCVC